MTSLARSSSLPERPLAFAVPQHMPALLFENNPQAMCIVRRGSLQVLAANNSAAAMYRYHRRDLLTRTLFELCDVTEHERLAALAGCDCGTRVQRGPWSHRRKDGKLLRVRATWTQGSAALRDTDADVMLWTFEDAEPIERVRAAARDSGAMLSSLCDDAPHGVCRFRLQSGMVEYANRVMLSVCGFSGDEEAQIYKRNALENCFVRATDADTFACRMKEADSFRQEVEWRGPDAVLRTVSIYAYPILKGVEGRTILFEDASAQRAIVDADRRDAKMESLGRVAATVAHDFNNILLVMRGYAEMLKRSLPTSSAEGRHAAALLEAADSAAEVTAALVGFSRKEESGPLRLHLNELARDLAGNFFPTLPARITGRLALCTEDAVIVAVQSDMQRALLNLAANARDAMPGGGQLTLTTRVRQSAGLYGREACVEIQDTGTGMDEGTRARIFERFFTTKGTAKGTGLGLAFVEACMTQLGGRVEVESRLGQGSCFRLVFPLHEIQTAVARLEAPELRLKVVEQRCATILLVDDDERIRSLICGFLETLKYKVIVADGAAAAMRIISECADPIDLLLTDVTMPGTAGDQLARQVREQWRKISVLLMSGVIDTGAFIEDRLSVIQKPFSIGEMAERIEKILQQRSLAAGELPADCFRRAS